MKTLITIILIALTTTTVRGDENCNKMEEYRTVTEEIKSDIADLEEKRDNELSKSDMGSILIDNLKSGSELLREQEEHRATAVSNNEESKKTTLKYIAGYGVALTALLSVSYGLYTAPPPGSKETIFSEHLFRDVKGINLSRFFSTAFAAILTGGVAFRIKEYHELSQDLEDIQLKMDHLAEIADIMDSIRAKKRILGHYQVMSKMLAKSCPSS